MYVFLCIYPQTVEMCMCNLSVCGYAFAFSCSQELSSWEGGQFVQ